MIQESILRSPRPPVTGMVSDPHRLRWLKNGDEPADGVAGWRELVEREQSAHVYLHPELVLSRQSANEEAPWGYARWDRAESRPATFAALAPRNIEIPLIPGVRWKPSLKAWRLIGNQILGDGSPAAISAFLDAAVAMLDDDRAACLLVEDLEVNSPLWQGLEDAGRRRRDWFIHYPLPAQDHQWIQFAEKAADYWRQFSKKTRYNLRRMTKRLDHSLVCFRSAGAAAAFLDKAGQVSRRSWQSKRLGPRIQGDPCAVAFIERLAACGGLRSYVLAQGGRPIAFIYGLQWNGTYYYEEIAYDAELASYSPGTVLLVRVLEDLIESDTPRRLDFGFGDSDYKRLFANFKTRSGPILIARRRLVPWAALRYKEAGNRLTAGLRAAVGRLGLRDKLRRAYRRGAAAANS